MHKPSELELCILSLIKLSSFVHESLAHQQWQGQVESAKGVGDTL